MPVSRAPAPRVPAAVRGGRRRAAAWARAAPTRPQERPAPAGHQPRRTSRPSTTRWPSSTWRPASTRRPRRARAHTGRSGSCWSGFAAQEAEHVAALTRNIRDAGGRPVAAGPGARARPRPAETALRLEELRAAAYLDQLGRIANAGLLRGAVDPRRRGPAGGGAARADGPRASARPGRWASRSRSARRSSARGSCWREPARAPLAGGPARRRGARRTGVRPGHRRPGDGQRRGGPELRAPARGAAGEPLPGGAGARPRRGLRSLVNRVRRARARARRGPDPRAAQAGRASPRSVRGSASSSRTATTSGAWRGGWRTSWSAPTTARSRPCSRAMSASCWRGSCTSRPSTRRASRRSAARGPGELRRGAQPGRRRPAHRTLRARMSAADRGQRRSRSRPRRRGPVLADDARQRRAPVRGPADGRALRAADVRQRAGGLGGRARVLPGHAACSAISTPTSPRAGSARTARSRSTPSCCSCRRSCCRSACPR